MMLANCFFFKLPSMRNQSPISPVFTTHMIKINLKHYLPNFAQEKAILSTQVLKLEDNIKEIKSKLTEALCDKDHLIQVLFLTVM